MTCVFWERLRTYSVLFISDVLHFQYTTGGERKKLYKLGYVAGATETALSAVGFIKLIYFD